MFNLIVTFYKLYTYTGNTKLCLCCLSYIHLSTVNSYDHKCRRYWDNCRVYSPTNSKLPPATLEKQNNLKVNKEIFYLKKNILGFNFISVTIIVQYSIYQNHSDANWFRFSEVNKFVGDKCTRWKQSWPKAIKPFSPNTLIS